MIFPQVQAEVRSSVIHGRGLFAIEPIPAGTAVVEWTGKRLSLREVKTLSQEVAWRVVQIGHDLYDFSPHEVPEDYLNHSCSPALGHDQSGRLCALHNIPAGGELTFDYFTTDVVGFESTICECQSLNCRGLLSGADFAKPEFRSRAYDTFAPHVKDLARQLDRYRLTDAQMHEQLRTCLSHEQPFHRVVDVNRGTATTLLVVQPGSPVGDVARTLEARIYETAPLIQQADVDTAAWHWDFEDKSGFFLLVEELGDVLQPIAAARFVNAVGTLDGLPNQLAFSVAFPGESLKAPDELNHDTVVMDLSDIVVAEQARGGGVATSWLYHAILKYSYESGIGMWVMCMNETELNSVAVIVGAGENFDDRLGYYDGVDTGYIFQWQSVSGVHATANGRLAAIPEDADGLLRSLRRRLQIMCHGYDPRFSSAKVSVNSIDLTMAIEPASLSDLPKPVELSDR